MTGTAIRGAFDYLLGDGMLAALKAVDANVSLQDGVAANRALDQVIVGGATPTQPDAGEGVDAYLELGAQHVEETFGIFCYIDCWRGGDDQAEARTAALDLFDAFVGYVRADLTLGGALNRWAQITDVKLGATQSDEESGEGRRSLVFFTIYCRNRY